jgi:hypothetical protein
MRAVFSLLLLGIIQLSRAQSYPREDVDLSQLTNDLLTSQDDNLSYEDLYENYAQFFSHPINLNKTTPAELRLLGILTDGQITELLAHIETHGKLISVYELQSLPSFDIRTVEKLAPFVIVIDPKLNIDRSFVQRITSSDIYFLSRWEKSLQNNPQYTTSDPSQKYFGSPDKLYNRFRASSLNDYSIGLTVEKDAGEKMTWNPSANQYGFDYLSWHVQLKNKWRIKNLILGDYQYQFGQGLVLGSGFGFGKSAETITSIKKSNIGFLPNTSANESGYMRGAAVTLSILPKLSLSSFYSTVLRDGSVEEDESPTFSSIIVSGLHRNETELSKRKAIRENNVGMIAEYRIKGTEVGVTFNEISFSVPSLKDPSAYNQFAFSGNVNRNAGIFVSTMIDNVSVFGEAAHSLDGGFAIVTGALASVSRRTDISMLFRKYDRDFHPFYSNGLSENTNPQNETGFYWGLKTKLSSQFTASAYTDLFQFPWLKFRTYKPSTGNELLGRLQYQPSKKVTLFLQWRREEKAQNDGDEHTMHLVNKRVKTNLCLDSDYYITEKIRLRSRVQMSEIVSDATTSGLAIIQDVIVKSGRFKFTGRYALFDTDDFDNRQYVYENDVLMAFSFPAYEGTGIRQYVIMEYKIDKHITLSARYSHNTIRRDQQPGVDTLESVKCQVMAKL